MSKLAPTEITALAGILGELDYYQILHLKLGATPADIKRAYHQTSRAFHPDGNRQHTPEVREAIGKIAKLVTEAYSVLNSPRRRQVYNQLLETGLGLRVQLAQAEATGGRQQTEARQGRTPQGRQYFNLASTDLRQRRFDAAVRNLKTALTFEPDNAFFKEQLASAVQQLRSQK